MDVTKAFLVAVGLEDGTLEHTKAVANSVEDGDPPQGGWQTAS